MRDGFDGSSDVDELDHNTDVNKYSIPEDLSVVYRFDASYLVFDIELDDCFISTSKSDQEASFVRLRLSNANTEFPTIRTEFPVVCQSMADKIIDFLTRTRHLLSDEPKQRR